MVIQFKFLSSNPVVSFRFLPAQVVLPLLLQPPPVTPGLSEDSPEFQALEFPSQILKGFENYQYHFEVFLRYMIL